MWLLEDSTMSEHKCPLRATSRLWPGPGELAPKGVSAVRQFVFSVKLSPYLCVLSITQENNLTHPA